MSETKRKVPKLRFPGFTEDWEQRKLGEIATVTGGGTPSTNISEYWNGDIDWYSPVEIGESRYVNGSIRKITKLGLEKSSAKILLVGTVLFTSRAGIGNTAILQVEGCTNQGFQSITPNLNELDTYFLYTMTPKLKRYGEITGAGSTFVEVSGKQMEQMNLMVPSIEEQKRVGELFKTMDDAITLHQRKLENLKLKKKALLQKLFPKNGEQFPELRFPGFTDAWEQRKLGELFDRYESRVETPHDGYWRLGLRSHCKGTFHTYVEPGSELETSDMNIVKAGNFILNITFAWELALAITDSDDDGKLVSHRFPQFKPKRNLLIKFFKHTLSNNKFKHHLQLASPGGAGRNKVLKINEMLKFELLFPNMEEQLAITKILEDFDNLITLHQHKLEHLQLQKKALLQQMFV